MSNKAKAEKVTEEIGKKVTQDLSQAVEGLKDGDFSSLFPLIKDYLVPTGIALLILFIGYFLSKFISRIASSPIRSRVDETLGLFVKKLVFYTLMVFTVLGVLGRFGISVASFTAVIAAAGFAVGLAFQGTLSNFAAGVLLMVFRPFKIGDYIKVAESEGSVIEIDLFTTSLNSLDNKRIIIPNSNITGNTIENLYTNNQRRVDVNVGTDYSADLKLTRKVLLEAASQVCKDFDTIGSKGSEVYLLDLGDSSVNWQVRVFAQPNSYWPIKQAITEAVKEHLDKAKIGIPFPQMDLNLNQEIKT